LEVFEIKDKRSCSLEVKLTTSKVTKPESVTVTEQSDLSEFLQASELSSLVL